MIRRQDDATNGMDDGHARRTATPDELDRRRKAVEGSFGMWSDEEGERIARWIDDSFRHPDPPKVSPK